MSSIFGILGYKGRPAEKDALIKMLDKLSYWNPDRTAIWHQNSIGMGQLMLCTTPESLHEELPYTEEELTITANARIDNREELFKQLNIRTALSETPDSILILKAYQKWKEDAPKHLTGEFAFAIWNEKEQSLFCVKDQIGVRPLYYSQTEEHFVFSSEIGGILSSGLVEKKLNDVMLAVHLLGFKGEKEQTSFKDILILPPAHWIKVTSNDVKIHRYWDIDLTKKIRYKSNEEYEEAFRYYLKQAVARRTRSAYPIASFLSGGLDSTSITGVTLKEKLNKTPLYLYSWAHQKGVVKEYEDDREYIDSFLKFHSDSKLQHKFQHGLDGYFSLLPQFQKYYDEPFRDLEHYTRFQSYQQASSDGVRTILSGVGGDELTSSFGYEYVVGLFFQLRFWRVAREIGKIKNAHNYTYKGTIKKVLIKPLKALCSGEEQWGRGAIDSGRNYLKRNQGSNYINKELVDSLDFDAFIEEHMDVDKLPNPLINPVKQRHYLNLHDGHLDVSFNQRYHASLAYGMQYTYPLLDKDLVEFCMALPANQFHQNGQGRSLIRRSMKNYVPSEILNRNTKYGTSPNLLGRIKSDEKWMRGMIQFGERDKVISNYIDVAKLESDMELFLKDEGSINSDFIRSFYMIYFLNKYK